MTEVVALFGDPVAGNPTSRMHNAAFRHMGLDWHYLDIRVLPADLGGAVAAARVLRFAGLNVTLPHKVAVIPYLDDLERSAAICGAVNTVRRDPDGRLIGTNTDGVGFLRAVRDADIDPAGLDVVLLGAGGAARAVAVELALAGARSITIAARRTGQREALAALILERTPASARGITWDGRLQPPTCDLLVNCTPVGMGRGDAARAVPDVDITGLPAACVVCDLNPDRADTAFLRLSRAAGHRALGGLPMLARQGAAGFEAWTGLAAPLEVMIAELERVADEP